MLLVCISSEFEFQEPRKENELVCILARRASSLQTRVEAHVLFSSDSRSPPLRLRDYAIP